jgi:copper chaperone CopZ
VDGHDHRRTVDARIGRASIRGRPVEEDAMNRHGDCHVTPAEKPIEAGALERSEAALLTIEGLGCPRCAARVRNGLLAVDGVVAAMVDHEAGSAAVAFDPELVSTHHLVDAVRAAGDDGRHSYRAVRVAVHPVAAHRPGDGLLRLLTLRG